jgi:hypothetical protein
MQVDELNCPWEVLAYSLRQMERTVHLTQRKESNLPSDWDFQDK